MITVLTLLIMFITAWSQYRNGLFTSIAMLIMVILSGLVAFNFWEPIADLLDSGLQRTALMGCEDMIVLTSLFGVSLFALRLASNYLNPDMIEEHGTLQHLGAMVVGLVTGYFVAGFLICTVQTLPLDEHFLDFQPRAANEPVFRSAFPPDRVWLALMCTLVQTPWRGMKTTPTKRCASIASRRSIVMARSSCAISATVVPEKIGAPCNI